MADCSNSEKDCQQRTGIVYKITNLEDGKVYVGQTVQKLNERLRQHKHERRKDHSLVDRVISKYGWENFKAEIIEECPREMLNEREKFWIKFYDCMAPKGYNLTSGGDSDFTVSDETREKLRVAGEGKILSEETRAKIGAAQIGHEVTPETRAKISAAKKGIPKTEEHKAKLSVANKGKKTPPETRAKLSAIHKALGTKPPVGSFKGRHHTPESKAKISESKKGSIPWNKGLKLSEKKNADIAISLFEDDNN
ncbi:MAG: GIY-YIG nuclease family protein [Selenomonadaceae bacterium]|nr:GIY-YIG nuclease family protein [Selenomonadaceae bacterium]